MGVRGSGLHPSDPQIKWAQAHSACEVLDGRVRFAEVYPRPAAVIPRRCQIWVERQRLIDEGGAIVEVADDKEKRAPLAESAPASSLPNSTARRASLAVSAISRSRSVIHLFTWRKQ